MTPGHNTDPNSNPPTMERQTNMVLFLNQCRAHLYLRDFLSERENENIKARFRKWMQRTASERTGE